MTTLLDIVRTSTASESDPRARLVQQRSLYTLHLVVKGLISKTLAASRKQFQLVAPDLFTNVVNIYVRYVDMLFASNTTNIESLSGCLETSHMALKCLRRVVVHGFPNLSTSEGPVAFFRLALEHLRKFISFKESIPEQCYFLITSVDSHIKLIGKFYLDLMDAHPRQFILTPGAGDVLRFYWELLAGSSNEHAAAPAQTTLIQALLLIKKTLKDPQFILNDSTCFAFNRSVYWRTLYDLSELIFLLAWFYRGPRACCRTVQTCHRKGIYDARNHQQAGRDPYYALHALDRG